MKQGREVIRMGCLLAALAGIAMPAVGAQPDAATGWAAVAGCAQQVTERARHRCLDQVLRDAGLLKPEAGEPEQPRAAVSGNAVTPPPPVVPARPAPPPAKAADPQPEKMEVEVASVATTPDRRRLIITTTEGAVWYQTEALEILPLPVAGDRMTLRKGALGGYFCRFGKSVTYRCTLSR